MKNRWEIIETLGSSYLSATDKGKTNVFIAKDLATKNLVFLSILDTNFIKDSNLINQYKFGIDKYKGFHKENSFSINILTIGK